ncbi:sensor histidine kinase [Hymenobacter sp. BT770]|uniref:sensor histidine kinase n=1 Tax=Hymenobacter sp. BT770 TaxID=2886942 RepID=UPI001D114665|nr:ATP-binding protein [Hymenobacter sp. BT770]MCC3154560.1 histidine kinase [Hymenobacter sp. BT770]
MPQKALLFLLLVWAGQLAVAQPARQPAVTLQQMPDGGIELEKGWTFHAGDNPDWARPDLDDSQWQPLNPTVGLEQLPPQVKQAGIGWLRLRFRLGPALQHRALALSIFQYAASEVYLNGRLLRRYGTVSANPALVQPYWPDGEPIELPASSAGAEQVLAVRFAQWAPFRAFNSFFVPMLVEAHLTGLPQLVQNFEQEATFKTSDMLLFGAFLLLSMLHFAYYYYNSTQNANIYFALYTLLTACSFCFTGFLDEIHRLNLRIVADILSYVCIQTGGMLAVRALYCLFNVRISLIYYSLWVANVVSLLLLTFGPQLSWYPTVIFMVLVTAEQLRLTLGALRRTKRAAGIIAAGYGVALSLLLVFAYMARYHAKLLHVEFLSIPLHTLLTFPAFLSPVLAISLFLTRRFALNGRLLAIKLDQVRRLSSQTLAQQHEKQQLLAQQNETLERLVQQRTAALQQTLDNLQNTQHQLIEREKMASLGELTAGIAHEIQNPLNFVNNFADVAVELLTELKEGPLLTLPEAEKKTADDLVDELTQDLDKITYHGHRADSIVKGMLEHSRANPGQRQPTDLNRLADEYMRLSYHGLRAKDKSFNATLTTDFDNNLKPVEVVAQDMGRVLLNLFNNAFYAVQQRQKLGQDGYRPEVCVKTQQLPHGQVAIRVKDNGTGMTDAVRQRIFQPFFTTKPTGEGTGLGLSLSYDIVTKGHNGTITVDSKPGEYTEFTICLPVNGENVQALTYAV